MLGSRSKVSVALDVLVIVTAVVRVLAGLEPFSDKPKSHPELRCDERPVVQDQGWRRLPPVLEVNAR